MIEHSSALEPYYFRVERPVFEASQQEINTKIARLTALPYLRDALAPPDDISVTLTTTLLDESEFAAYIPRTPDFAPLMLIPTSTWESALKTSMQSALNSNAPTRALVGGLAPIDTSDVDENGYVPLMLALKSGQLTRERMHLLGKMDKLTLTRVQTQMNDKYDHTLEIGTVQADITSPVLQKISNAFKGKLVELDPIRITGNPASMFEDEQTMRKLLQRCLVG